jgi:hypothetical protein
MSKVTWYLDRLREMLNREDTTVWIYRGLHVRLPYTRRNADFCLNYLTVIATGDRLGLAEVARRLGYAAPDELLTAISKLPVECHSPPLTPPLPNVDRAGTGLWQSVECPRNDDGFREPQPGPGVGSHRRRPWP